MKVIKSYFDSLLQAASTTWIAEFFRLEFNGTDFNMSLNRLKTKQRLTIGKELFENILSDPNYPVVLFSTVRHPIER